MELDRETVVHVAKLARVALSDEEIELFSRQLSDILAHFDVLQRVDTQGVEPTAHTLPLRNVMADDESRASMDRDTVLELAPNVEEGYVRVRAVLE